jgi:hypothetical protein
MHDLIPVDAIRPGALTVAEVDATMAYAEAEKSAATRAGYASDWRDFAVWCHARGASLLPAHPGLVAAYLSDLAQVGRRAASHCMIAEALKQTLPAASGIAVDLGTIRWTDPVQQLRCSCMAIAK